MQSKRVGDCSATVLGHLYTAELSFFERLSLIERRQRTNNVLIQVKTTISVTAAKMREEFHSM